MSNVSRTNFCYLSNDVICIPKRVDRKIILPRVITLRHFPLPSPIFFLFRTNITYHEHNTRSASCLHTPIGRSEAIYQTFSCRGVHICNYKSLKVNTDVSYACFKKLVKHHLQSNPTPLIRQNVYKKKHRYFEFLNN